MNKKEKEAFVALAKELHKDHGYIGAESFETCTAEICVMARSVAQLTKRQRGRLGMSCQKLIKVS